MRWTLQSDRALRRWLRPRLGRLCAEPTSERVEAVPVELLERSRPTGECKQQGFARTGHLWAVAVDPVEVGCIEPEAGGVAACRQHGRSQGNAECLVQPVARDVAMEPERTTDVLMVDEAVAKSDAAAEPGGEAARSQVGSQEADELFRCPVGQ